MARASTALATSRETSGRSGPTTPVALHSCDCLSTVTSPEQARELALALPDAAEQDHHGRASFRIAGKIFATLWDESHMNLMLDEPGIHTAVQDSPEACSEFRWGARLRAVHVDLERIDPSRLAELLADAWERNAPRR
jgi:hypothetical protein